MGRGQDVPCHRVLGLLDPKRRVKKTELGAAARS